MTEDEFMARVLKMLPEAHFGENGWTGEIAIYTGLKIYGDEVVEIENL